MAQQLQRGQETQAFWRPINGHSGRVKRSVEELDHRLEVACQKRRKAS